MPIDKKPGESKDDFINRCMSVEVGDGKPQDQAYAICISKWEEFATQSVSDATWSGESPINVNMESYSDYPEGVKSNAKKVLDWTEKNGWGSCGTNVGKVRANQLANGEPISVETIKRMYSYLSRHSVDLESSTSYSDGCGLLMYDSWGGKAALRWAESKLKEIGEIELIGIKVSFDYDETLTTEKGMEMAKRAISKGDIVYIISARRDKEGMMARAKLLGIPESRVFATGSNSAKIQKIKDLNIDRHIDNNLDVVENTPGVGEKFGKIKRVLFDEDFNEEDIKRFKSLGYSVHIKSKRKIKRSDGKKWNKMKSVNLTEDNMVYGDLEQLDRRWDYDLVFCDGGDPLLNKLLLSGKKHKPKKVLDSKVVKSMEEALALKDWHKDFNIKFAKVSVVYVYEEIPGIPPAKAGSRPFCKKLTSSSREWTIDEIYKLPTSHLADMGLPTDPFQFRGGFYRNPDSGQTTPFCRHQWTAKVVIS